ncbi:MAG: hypothetical protein GX804_07330 [Lentisphaerae bacterium]|nr:hypothetical protein [Lentisphaerota bacterium]
MEFDHEKLDIYCGEIVYGYENVIAIFIETCGVLAAEKVGRVSPGFESYAAASRKPPKITWVKVA